MLFANHDRSACSRNYWRFIPTSRECDAVTERVKAAVEHWVPLYGRADATLRDRIAADGIDVLIDLAGHTADNRLGLFARRAAPVQAHYFGILRQHRTDGNGLLDRR